MQLSPSCDLSMVAMCKSMLPKVNVFGINTCSTKEYFKMLVNAFNALAFEVVIDVLVVQERVFLADCHQSLDDRSRKCLGLGSDLLAYYANTLIKR